MAKYSCSALRFFIFFASDMETILRSLGNSEYYDARVILAFYGPMIYTASYKMLLMRENPLRGQVGGGWALEIETFLGPVIWHRAV